MTRAWIEPVETEIPEALHEAIGGHPLVAGTLARRGFADVGAARAFLDPARYTPSPPEELPGLERAAARIETAMARGEAICVWGDFDVDGQTATTLLVSALRDLGAQVIYHIPVRARESHGVSVPVLERILDRTPSVGLLLTCDTGIAAHEAVEYARGRGVDVVVSDHHELPERLPEAHAVVNPKLLPDGHPLSTLPGVGVAYKLVEALYRSAGRPEDCELNLDLVALGIVADVAEQVGDTRYLLQRGLAKLRDPQRVGLQSMMELAELNPTWLSEEHIGFVLGPRLNALGRLGDANPVVELLTTADRGRARTLAHQLEGLNSRRQLLTSQVYQGALASIEQEPSLLDHAALVLAHPSWPAGVIGIVASRLVERFHKPTILIATPEGEVGRASARSVEGVDITAMIATQRELLAGFGGHSMAAGCAIEPQNVVAFRSGLSRQIEKLGDLPVASLAIDGDLALGELSLDLVADLERLAPFGPGNPPLVLAARGVKLLGQAKVGRSQEHLLLTVEDEAGATQRVIWWSGGDYLDAGLLPEGRFDLAYTARTSTFRGQRDVQVEWIDFRQVAEDQGAVHAAPALEVIDYRQEAQPLPRLNRLEGAFQVWAEGEALERLRESRLSEQVKARLRQRFELPPAETLAIWTTPPGRAELCAALELVGPERLVLFAVDPREEGVDAFLKRLAGLVKYALQARSGQVSSRELAAAMAHRQHAVQLGIDWLAGQGHLRVVSVEEDTFTLAPGEGRVKPDAGDTLARLRALLEETRAYRAYFRRANTDTLLAPD